MIFSSFVFEFFQISYAPADINILNQLNSALTPDHTLIAQDFLYSCPIGVATKIGKNPKFQAGYLYLTKDLFIIYNFEQAQKAKQFGDMYTVMFLQTTKIDWTMTPQIQLDNCGQIVKVQLRYQDAQTLQQFISTGQLQIYTCDVYSCLPLVKTAADFEQLNISGETVNTIQSQSQNSILNKQQSVKQAVQKFNKKELEENDDNNLAISSVIQLDLSSIADQGQQQGQNLYVDENVQMEAQSVSIQQLEQNENDVKESFVQLYSVDPTMIQEQINTFWLTKRISPDKDICETYKHAKLAAYSDDIIYQYASDQRFVYQQLQQLTPISMLQQPENIDRESLFHRLYELTGQVGEIKSVSKQVASQFIKDFVLPFHEKSKYMSIYPNPTQEFIQNYQTQLQWFDNWKLQYGPQLLEQKMLQLGPVYASMVLSNKLPNAVSREMGYLSQNTLSSKPLALTNLHLFENNQFETALTTSNEIYPNPINPAWEGTCGNIKLELLVTEKKQVNQIRTNEADSINDEYQRISCQQNDQQEIISYLGHNCRVSVENVYEDELIYGFNDDQLFVDNRSDKSKGNCIPHIIYVDLLRPTNQQIFTDDYPLEQAYQQFINELETNKKFILSQFFSKFRQQIVQGLKNLRQNEIHTPGEQRIPIVTNLSALTLIKNNKIQNIQSFATHDINSQLLQQLQQQNNISQKLGIQYHMSFATLSQEFLNLMEQTKLNPDCNAKQFQITPQQVAILEKQVEQIVQNNQVKVENIYPYIIAKMQQIQNQKDLLDQVKISDIYHQKWLKFVAIKLEEAYHSKNIQLDQFQEFFQSLHIQEFYWYEIVQQFNDKVLKQQMKTLLAGYFASLQIKYLMRKLGYEAQQFGLKPQKIQQQTYDYDIDGNQITNTSYEQLFWWYGKKDQETGQIVSCKDTMYQAALKTLVIDYLNKIFTGDVQQWSELQGYVNTNFNFMTKNSEVVSEETIFNNQYQLKYLFLQQIINNVGIQLKQYITTAYLQQNNWKICTVDIDQFIPVVVQNDWSQLVNKILTVDELVNLQKQVLCQFTQPNQLNADLLINDTLLLKEQLEPGFQYNNLIMNIKQFIYQYQANGQHNYHQITLLINSLIRCDQLYVENKLNDSLLNVNQLIENIKFETVLNQLIQNMVESNKFNKILELQAVYINQMIVDHINQTIIQLKKRTPSIENNKTINTIITIAEQNLKINKMSTLAVSRQTYIENNIQIIDFICQKVNKLISKENYMSAASLIEMYLEDWTQQNLGLPLIQIICVLASIYSKMGRHAYAIEIYKQALQRLQQYIENQRNLVIYYTDNVPEQQLWQTTKFIQQQEGNQFILSVQNTAQKLFIIRAQLVNNICKTACKAYAFSFLGDLISELKNMLILFVINNQAQISSNIITDMIYTIAKTYELMQKNSDAIIYYEMILKTRVIIEVSQNIHWQAFKQLFGCILKMQNKNVMLVQNKMVDIMQTHYIILRRPDIESVLREILNQQNITQYIIQLYDSVQQAGNAESARKLILLQCYLRGDNIEDEQKQINEESSDEEEGQKVTTQIENATAQEIAQQIIAD